MVNISYYLLDYRNSNDVRRKDADGEARVNQLYRENMKITLESKHDRKIKVSYHFVFLLRDNLIISQKNEIKI